MLIMKKLKIGLIGCGAIGRAIAQFLTREFPHRVQIAYVCEHQPQKVLALCKELGIQPRVESLRGLIQQSDFVIEAAGTQAAGEAAALALRAHKQIMVMSAGGLISDSRWLKEVKSSRGNLWVPSGAVAGLDGLLAAREAGLKRVRLITRKPPAALQGADYFKKRPFPPLRGKKQVCIYRGTAKQAVVDFPQNVNVAAVLSLAGLGAAKTRVEIWTSRGYRGNCHEIQIESAAGEISVRLNNVPAAGNPKTSALAFYSAMALLRRIFSSVRVGT